MAGSSESDFTLLTLPFWGVARVFGGSMSESGGSTSKSVLLQKLLLGHLGAPGEADAAATTTRC